MSRPIEVEETQDTVDYIVEIMVKAYIYVSAHPEDSDEEIEELVVTMVESGSVMVDDIEEVHVIEIKDDDPTRPNGR